MTIIKWILRDCFATITTLFVNYGLGKEESATYTIIIVSLLVVGAQFFTYRKEYSLIKDGLRKKCVAVLPIINRGATEKDDYFSDGVTAELISKLSKIRSLGTIALTSVIRHKFRRNEVPQIRLIARIGQEWGVRAILN